MGVQGVWTRLSSQALQSICPTVMMALSPMSVVYATPPESTVTSVEVDMARVEYFAVSAGELEQEGSLREAARHFIRATAELAADEESHLRAMTVYLEKAVVCYERVSKEIAGEMRYAFEQEVVESIRPYIHILRRQQESNPNAKRAGVLRTFDAHVATYLDFEAALEREEESLRQQQQEQREENIVEEERVERRAEERDAEVERRIVRVHKTEKHYKIGMWTSVGVAGAIGVVALGALMATRRNGSLATSIQRQLAWDSHSDAMQNATLDVCALEEKGSDLRQLCRRFKTTHAVGVTSALIASVGAASAVTFGVLLLRHRKNQSQSIRGPGRAVLDSIYAGPTPRGVSMGATLRF